MIQNIEKGRGFRGALNYTLEKDGAELIGGNMAGRTPRELSAEFRAVRELRPDVERAVFHASLSAPVGERVSEAQWVAIADRYAERMGFGESAYVVVRHVDRDHDHVHIVASRVDAYGRVVSDAHDRYRGQEVLRAIEREHQLTPVRSSWDKSRETPERQLTKAEVQQLRDAVRDGRPPFADVVREHAGEAFRAARSWGEVERRLADVGLRVEPRRGGLVVTDGTEAAKASSVGREYSRAKLEQRFGVTYGEWTEQRDQQRAAERATERGTPDRDAADRDARDRGLAAARGADGADRGGAADRAGTGRAVADGAASGGPSAGAARGDGAERVRPQPGRGPAREPVRGADPLRAPGRGVGDPAPAAREPSAPAGRAPGAGLGGGPGSAGSEPAGHDGDRLAALRGAIRQDLERIEWRHGVEAARAQAGARADGAERRLAALTTGRDRDAGAAETRFTRALGAVYRDPAAARAAIEERARTAGWSETVREVRGNPAAFGELHGHRLGRLAGTRFLDGGARERALAAAPELARTAGDHLAAQAALRQGRHEVAALTRAVQAGRDEARQLGERLAGLPSERELLRRVGEQARGLPREAVEQVQRGLTQVQRVAFGRALALAKEAALGRDDRGMER